MIRKVYNCLWLQAVFGISNNSLSKIHGVMDSQGDFRLSLLKLVIQGGKYFEMNSTFSLVDGCMNECQ